VGMNKKERLLELIRKNTVRGKIRLSSGRISDYYIDCRMVSLDPEGATLIGEILFDMLKNEDMDAVGGPTLSAVPIITALAVVSYQRGRPIPVFIIRKEKKRYGRRKVIEGLLEKNSRVVIVDDVATTGNSLINAINAVREEGCEVKRVVVIVDREESARDRLREMGYKLESIFNVREILK